MWRSTQPSLDGEPLHLTPMEFSLMTLLMKNAGQGAHQRLSPQRKSGGVSYDSDTQALRALMAALRRKIEKIPQTEVSSDRNRDRVQNGG